ncbi:hypothetical protein Fuma_01383 [Fuerstiella marisgermanici]|uniref:Uncharacterized protein n=1 Tax=Fuerstiella marisgermanici TaxID=1891926 RepID=A0A1P8WCL9_9PLAN|nr:hypothetical protein Fuma_01383 [Fuerstiella marisgermanici]
MDSETSRLNSTWEPIPRSKCRQLASAGALGSDILKTVIFFGGVVLSILVCAKVFGRPAPLYKDPVWWVCTIVLIAGPFLSLEWMLNRLHRRKTAVDQPGTCLLRNFLRQTGGTKRYLVRTVQGRNGAICFHIGESSCLGNSPGKGSCDHPGSSRSSPTIARP